MYGGNEKTPTNALVWKRVEATSKTEAQKRDNIKIGPEERGYFGGDLSGSRQDPVAGCCYTRQRLGL